MKKIIAILTAAALILSAAGCNTDEKPSETSGTTKSKDGKVTQVIFGSPEEEEEDTSAEALAFLKEQIPLYARYLETRRSIPLTYETAVVSEGARVEAGVYIKDSETFAVSATDEDGNTIRVVYKDGMAYEVDEAERTIRYMKYSAESTAALVEGYRIKLKLSEVQKCTYVDDIDELNGVTYQHEIIYDENSSPSNFYYDMETGDLRFIRVGEEINEVLVLNNEVKESAFDVPTDYTMIDYDAYLASEYAKQSEEISKKNEEVLEAAKAAATSAVQ